MVINRQCNHLKMTILTLWPTADTNTTLSITEDKIGAELEEYLFEAALYGLVTLLTPEAVEETEPLVGVLPDKGFI